MQQVQSNANGLPAGYRIGLAISGALLVHTLLLSGLSSPLHPTEDPAHRVTVELITPGLATQSQDTAAPNPGVATTPEPDNRDARTEIASAPDFTAKRWDPGPAPAPEQTQTQSRSPDTSKASAISSSRGSVSPPANAGQQAVEPAPGPVATATQITQSPDETDPYLTKLAVHLGYELEKLQEPTVTQLTERVAMEIELNLLGNGALTRARIVKSTGMRTIDEAAYRAALAASPYPEPPANGKSRFEVELVFSPNRL